MFFVGTKMKQAYDKGMSGVVNFFLFNFLQDNNTRQMVQQTLLFFLFCLINDNEYGEP